MKAMKYNFLLSRFFRFCLVFVLITAWLFSGFPRIWQNPAFPPKIQEAKALTTDTYYGTYDSVKSTMTNPVNAETDNTQYAYGGKNTLVVIQSWGGTAGSGTISGVRIYCQHYATTPDGDDYTLVEYSLDDWVTTGATSGQQPMPASEASFSVDITADRSWTWTDITNLEVRATAKASGKQNFTNDYIDVLYIQVDYTPGLSTAIEIRAQDYTTAVAIITFPEGTPGSTVSNPSNDQSETQTFGSAGTAKPVVTLYNGGASTLTIWYNITTFTNSIVSNEYYLINNKGAACADDTVITNAVTFDTDTVSAGSTTIAAGAGNERDFYLKVTLSALAGKSGDSTLTILGATL